MIFNKQIIQILTCFLCLIIAFLTLALTLNVGHAQTKITTIKVGAFPYPDQLEWSEIEGYHGYGYDYLQEIAKYTHWRYEFVDGTWEQCLQLLKEGKIQLMGAVMKTPDREKVYDFSTFSMISGYGVLATTLSNSTMPYEDVSHIQNLKVGVLKGNVHKDSFMEYCNQNNIMPNLTEFTSQEALDSSLEDKTVNAVVTSNVLQSNHLRVVAKFGENDAYFATTKGNDALLNELNDAMRRIRLNDPYFNSRLDEKYYDLQSSTPISFTRAELDFIENSPSIPCVTIPNAPPFSYFDEKFNSISGIAVDVCSLLTFRTGLTFNFLYSPSANTSVQMLQDGTALLIPAKYNDANWAQLNNATLTSAYLMGQMIMVSSASSNPPKVIALYDQDFQSRLSLTDITSGMDIKIYSSVIDCIDAVLKNEAAATFVNSTIASYLLNEPKYSNLHTSPLYGAPADIAMAISSKADPLLRSVLEKGIKNISYTEMNEIVLSQMKNKYTNKLANFLYLHPIEIIFFIAIIFVLLLLVLLMLFLFRENSSKKLQKALYHDGLTGLPNYRALLQNAHAQIQKKKDEYALIYLDIQKFKVINDTFDYAAGDKVLTETSHVLNTFIQAEEFMARLYADKFVLLLKCSNVNSLKIRLTSLIGILNNITIDSNGYPIIFLGGVYILPSDLINLDIACDRANYAKNSLSRLFTSSFAFYDDIIRNRILKENELESGMHSALNSGQFVPYYQPKINGINGKVIGAEALVRWIHPDKGLIYPGNFLPFYEQNGFITKIDLSIFEQVCSDISVLIKAQKEVMPVSINLSRKHIHNPHLPQTLKQIADAYNVPTHYIDIEVTETEDVENIDTAVEFVKALKALGFSISIDDYGRGYSSLTFIQQLPFDTLKLDRSFILSAMKNEKAKDIMKNLVSAMQKNDIQIVCEGIETLEQKNFIFSLNCHVIQGFYYSAALSYIQLCNYIEQYGIDCKNNIETISFNSLDLSIFENAKDFLLNTLSSYVISCFDEPSLPVQFIHPYLLEKLGYSELQFKLEMQESLLKCIHPGDAKKMLESINHTKNMKQSFMLQYRMLKKDGTYMWIREQTRRVASKEGRVLLLGFCTDITDVMTLQEERKQLIDTIPGGVATLELTTSGPIIHKATQKFYEVLGSSKERMQQLNNNILNLIDPRDIPIAKETLLALISGEQDTCACSFRVINEQQETHYITFRGTLSRSLSNCTITVIIMNNQKED